MKTAAVLFALLVVVVGAIGLRRVGSVSVNRPTAQPMPAKRGNLPFEGSRKSVTLFFRGRGARSFNEERREIESGATTAEEAKRILTELVKGPRGNDFLPTVPREAKLLNLFIDSSGTAYADFNQALRDGLPGGAQEELDTVFSIVNTLASNFVRITRVQILVEGAEVPTLAGHVDTRMALSPQYIF